MNRRHFLKSLLAIPGLTALWPKLSTPEQAPWTHTPVGTPRGIIVQVVQNAGTDEVTGVTYGSVAMTEDAEIAKFAKWDGLGNSWTSQDGKTWKQVRYKPNYIGKNVTFELFDTDTVQWTNLAE